MRRGEQPRAAPGSAVDALQHGAGGTFAIGASHVDETQFRLRIACQCGQFERVFQTELGTEQAQSVQKLNGSVVGHRFTLKVRS